MNETNYIKRLSDEEKDELLIYIGIEEFFPSLSKLFPEAVDIKETRRTFNIYIDGNYKSGKKVMTWNVEREFTEFGINKKTGIFEMGQRNLVRVCMNDFDIFEIGVANKKSEVKVKYAKKLYEFMYAKFGEDYKKDCLHYLKNSRKRQIEFLNEKFDKKESVMQEMKPIEDTETL